MNRLKELRKTLGMNQEKFADVLKMSSSSISKIEKGERNLTERLANQISKEFGANEKWLLTGEGEMFRFSSEDDKLAELMGSILSQDDEFMKKVILTFGQLTQEQRDFIKGLMKQLTT